jgi:hypothetical protein
MNKFLLLPCVVALLTSLSAAQEAAQSTIDVHGDQLADAEKMVSIWLYPEDYESKTIRLYHFCFEPENFEFFPDINGYLFSCEPAVYGRNSIHPHIGRSQFLSREKLNLFCSTSEGQRIRQLFKERQGDVAMPAEVVLRIEKRDYIYYGVLVSYKPQAAAQQPASAR